MVSLRWRACRAASVTATAAEVISTRTPVAYAPPWASTSASEDDRDEERAEGEDQHQRTHGAGPVRGHPVPGQVARDQVQQAGHRRRAGEPQDRNRRGVVHAAEGASRGTHGPGRPAPARWPTHPAGTRPAG